MLTPALETILFKRAPVAAGGGSLTFTIPGATNTGAVSATPALPYTFSGLNIGTASSDRIVVVVLQALGSGNITAGHVTANAGAVTFTEAVHYLSTSHAHSIWYALITTGTTMNLSVTATGGSGFLTEILVEVGLITGSATASIASTVSSLPPGYPNAYSNVNTASLTVPTGGVAVISAVSDIGAPNTISWSGTSTDLTVDSAQLHGYMAHATASGSITQTVGNAGGSGWAAAVFAP